MHIQRDNIHNIAQPPFVHLFFCKKKICFHWAHMLKSLSMDLHIHKGHRIIMHIFNPDETIVEEQQCPTGSRVKGLFKIDLFYKASVEIVCPSGVSFVC